MRKGAAGADELINRHGGPASATHLSLTAHMLHADPPDHTRLRNLVNKAFTGRAVDAWRPRIEEITAALLDDMAAHAEADLMAGPGRR